MAYLGLVPSERSTGESVRRGSITKGRQRPGAARAGRGSVELPSSAPRRGREAGAGLGRAEHTRDRLKAQVRLTKRFRTLSRRAKATVVATAIARELAAFIWDIARSLTMPADHARLETH
jgi:hypothetical protein